MNVLDFAVRKAARDPITVTTCYDYWSARLLSETGVDALLVGDSVAMVMHGFVSTVSATLEMMAWHTAAVRRGAPDHLIVADMPFLSFRRGVGPALDAVDALMKAGANAIKLEGVRGHEDVVAGIVGSGVPVMGHVGLTPQAVHGLGGYRVQGRNPERAREIEEDARRLDALGCFAIVLECVPRGLAATVTAQVSCATIGIGAGRDVDGQVLVLHDLLGLQRDVTPRFVRRFVDGFETLRGAVDSFRDAVREGRFPADEETYS